MPRPQELQDIADKLVQYSGVFSRADQIRRREEEQGLVDLAVKLMNYRSNVLLSTLSRLLQKHDVNADSLDVALNSAASFNNYALPEDPEVAHYRAKTLAILELLETLNLGDNIAPAQKYQRFMGTWSRHKDTILAEYHYLAKPSWFVNSFAAITPAAVGNLVKSYEKILVEEVDALLHVHASASAAAGSRPA